MLDRHERGLIEKQGVLKILAVLMYVDEDITLDDIEIITDKKRQFKGIDYIVTVNGEQIKIDSKYHTRTSKKQRLTPTGVDAISVEVCTRRGLDGWGLNRNKETDIIIDYTDGTAVYFIDVCALRKYMRVNYDRYPTWYSQEGLEDYRGVSIQDLLDNDIITAYTNDPSEFADIESLADDIKTSVYYESNIKPQIELLV